MTIKPKGEMTLLDILCEVGAQQQAEEKKMDMKRCNNTATVKTEKKKQNGAARPPRMAQTHLKEEIRVRAEAVQSGLSGRKCSGRTI